MTKSGASVFYFGMYLLLLGLLFIVLPVKILSIAKLPLLHEGWARIVGFLAIIIGLCDVICGKNNVGVMVRASVFIRIGFAASIALLNLFHQMPASILFFGAVDVLGALWTAVQLRAEKKTRV